jgi:UDP-glucose 4-epimerase
VTKVANAEEGGKIEVWGQGSEERDLLYVSDLVNFVKIAIDKQKSKFELFNAGYGGSISIKELVKKIIYHSGKRIDIEFDNTKPSIKTIICLDTTKAKEFFGWSPEVSIDEGIIKTLKWYSNNIKLFKDYANKG